MTSASNDSTPILARYRPGGVWWFIVLLITGIALAEPVAAICTQQTVNLLNAWEAGGVLLLFCVVPILFLAKAIDADDVGLTILDWRGRKRILWQDVQDYYQGLPHTSTNFATIRTSAGDIMLSSADYGYDGMLQCVLEHTQHLPVREWEVLGCRPNDPAAIVFQYTWRFRAALGVLSAALTVSLLVMVSHGLIRDWLLLRQFASLGWAIGFVVLALQLPVFCGLVTWAYYLTTKESWDRRNERITITANGIRFEDAVIVVDAPWSAVTEWHSQEVKGGRFVGSNIVVVTQNGSFDVSSQIGINSNLETMRLLRILLERYAGPDTQPDHNSYQFTNAARRWARVASEGAQVHHYRTPINRAHLLMLCAYPLTLLVALIAGYSIGTVAVSKAHVVYGAIVFAIVIAYTQWRYRTAAVITDDKGICVHTVLGERRLAWDDIISYRRGEYQATVRSKYSAVRFWVTISDMEVLQKTIQERAVNCPITALDSPRSPLR